MYDDDRQKRQHVRPGRRERPRPRCLQGLGDERSTTALPSSRTTGRTASTPTKRRDYKTAAKASRTASTALPPRYSRRASPRRWRGSSSTKTKRSAEVALAAPDATKGGVDEEEGRASWWLFQFLAILLELVLGLFVFGRIIPRRSSSAKGAAWRSYVVGYLLFGQRSPSWRRRRLRSAAATTPLRRVPRSRPMSLRARQSKALSSGACSRAT